MNNNPDSIPSAKEFIKSKKQKGGRDISAKEFLEKKKKSTPSRARKFLESRKSKKKEVPQEKTYPTGQDSPDPVARQRSEDQAKQDERRERTNKRSKYLDEDRIKNSNRYLQDVTSSIEELDDEQKQQFYSTLDENGLTDNRKDTVVTSREFTGEAQQVADTIKNTPVLKEWADSQIGDYEFEDEADYDNALISTVENMEGDTQDIFRNSLKDQGLIKENKEERIVERTFKGDKFDLLNAIGSNPEIKEQILSNLSDDYGDLDPYDLEGNIEARKEMEGVIQDVKMRGELIDRLSEKEEALKEKSEKLRNESVKQGAISPDLKTGTLRKSASISNPEKYEEFLNTQKEIEKIRERRKGLEEEQQYLTGTDQDREEMDENPFQQSIEEAGKGLARGVINLPKSVATIGSVFGKNPLSRMAWGKVEEFLQDKNESEALAKDINLKGKKLEDVYDDPSKLIPHLTGGVGEAAPTMIPGLAAAKALSGAGRFAQIAGAAIGSAPIETGAQLEDAKRTAKAEGRELTGGEKALAVGSGLLAAGVEGIADAGLMRGILRAVDKSGVNKTAKEAIKKEVGEEVSSVALQSAKQAKRGFTLESGTEMVQNTVSNIGAKYGWDVDREVLEGIADAGVIGGLTGGVISGGATAIGGTANNRSKEAEERGRELLNTPYKSPLSERSNQGGEISEEIGFEYDPEAPVEEQQKQLSREREKLEAMRTVREATGGNVEAIDNALAKLDEVESDISSTNEVDLNEVKREQEKRKREARKEEVRTNFNTLEKVEGEQVEYGEYKGTLTRDEEGTYVVDTGDTIVEVKDSNKDSSKRIEDLGLERTDTQSREAVWTGENSIEITNTETKSGEQETTSYEFEQFNENENGDITSVSLRTENGEKRTVRDPNIVSRLLIDDYFRGASEEIDIDSEVNEAIEEVVQEDQSAEEDSDGEISVIDDTDPRVDNAFAVFDDGRKLTPEENSAVMDWIDDTIDKIEETNPANADELLNQLGQFENEVNEKTFFPPEGQEPGSRVGQQGPVNENQNETNEVGPKEEGQGVQQSQEEVEPFITQDGKYEVFVDETGTIQTKNTKTGKLVGNTSKNRKGVLIEYLASGEGTLQTLDQIVQQYPEMGQEFEKNSYLEMVAKYSNNPVEIIEAIESRQKEINEQQDNLIRQEADWGEGATLLSSSVKRYGDWDSLPQNIKAQTRNEKKEQKKGRGEQSSGLAADEIAEIINRERGTDFTPSDIVQDWLEFQESRLGAQDQVFTDEISNKLAERFADLTGQKYEAEFADAILEEHVKQEGDIDSQEQYDELAKEADYFIDDSGNINYTELPDNASKGFLQWLGKGEPITQEDLNHAKRQEEEAKQGTENEQDAEIEAEASQNQSPEEQWRGFGSQQDFEEAQQLLEEALREQGGQLNAGIDPRSLSPKLIKAGIKLAGYAIQDGAIAFGDFASRMIDLVGEGVKPFLRDIYSRMQKRFDEDFSSAEEVDAWMDQNSIEEELPFQIVEEEQQAPIQEEESQPNPSESKDQLKSSIETSKRDQSDYIKRRLNDLRDNPLVTKSLEDTGKYNVQNVDAANTESDKLINDLQGHFGKKRGLVEAFKLLKSGNIPSLMVGPMADKIGLKMQALGMNAGALKVFDWLQEELGESARTLRSVRSDASPESTVSRAFAGLERKKQEALDAEFKDGKSYNEILDEIQAALKDLQNNTDGKTEEQVKIDMLAEVNELLSKDGKESKKEKKQKEEAAENIVDGFLADNPLENISDSLDEVADFEVLTTEQKGKIIEMATESSSLYEAGKKELARDKWVELMDYLENLEIQTRPTDELIWDLWYTAVLSGLTTVARSLKGSALTASLHTVVKLWSNPKVAPLAFTQMLKGFRGGSKTYLNVLKTGKTNVQFADFNPQSPRYTNKLVNTGFGDLSLGNQAMKALYTLPVYMYRNILAADQVLKNGFSEANAVFNEYDNALDPKNSKSRLELIEEVRDRLRIAEEAKAEEQASEEVKDMKENGERVPIGYERRRAREIINNQRNHETVKKAVEEAARSALVAHPVGALGQVYQYANNFLEVEGDEQLSLKAIKYGSKALFPFLRVGLNYTNAGLDYTPYGLVRASKGKRWTKNGMEELGQTEKNRLRLSSAIGVSTFATMLHGMFDWDEEEGLKLRDEEDRWIDIVGSGTGNWWEEKDIAPGFKPWSVRIRNPFTGEMSDYYSFIDNPVGFALAPIGMMADEQKYKDFKKESRGRERPEELRGMTYLMGMGIVGTFQYSMAQSFNQGMNALGKIMDSDNTETFSSNMYSAFGRPVEGFYPNVYNQMYSQYRALMDVPEKEANTWYERPARLVPFADGILKNDRVDVFGYPVIKEFQTPLVPDMLLKMAKENLDYRESIEEWNLIHKYDEVVVGSFLPPFTHDGKRLTDEQRNHYKEEAGLVFRSLVQKKMNRFKRFDAKRLQKELLKEKRKASKRAKQVILDGRGLKMSEERKKKKED